jgi:DNA-nicking Smr family endonuclease
MPGDIDFEKAMVGVRRLKKETALPTPTRQLSNPRLRAEIHHRAIHSATSLDDTGLPKAPSTGFSNADEEQALFFLRDGVQKKILRELKRGTRYPIDITLDLHGLTQLQAQQEIDATLMKLEAAQSTCLLIIHGKGLHSSLGTPLKTFCARYLKTLRPIKAYCSARQHDGGTGALYVLARA